MRLEMILHFFTQKRNLITIRAQVTAEFNRRSPPMWAKDSRIISIYCQQGPVSYMWYQQKMSYS